MAEKVVKRRVVKKKEKKKRTKKQKLFRLFMFLLVVGGIVSFLLFFPSCGILDTMTKGFSTRYEFSSQYKASSTFEMDGYIDNLNINWRDGDVKVYTHEEEHVSIVETPNETITEKYMMHYNYQETDKYGHSLLVQYCKSGKWKFGNLKKDLVVYIPSREDLHLTIHTYNGDIDFNLGETKLSEIQIQSNHGSVDGVFSSADKATMLGSNSKTVKDGYHFNIKQTGTVDDFRTSSCQKMDLNLNKINRLESGCVYNDLIIKVNEGNKLDIKNSSGNTYLYLIDVKNTSFKNENIGKLFIYLLEDSNYQVSITKKDVNSSEPHGIITNDVCEQIDELNYKIGSGDNKINITIGGNIDLIKNIIDIDVVEEIEE